MKGIILAGALVLLLLPSRATANPGRWGDHMEFETATLPQGNRGISCNTGGATSLVVGAAVFMLLVPRRR